MISQEQPDFIFNGNNILSKLDDRIKELESVVQEQNKRIQALEKSFATQIALQHGINIKE